MSESGTVIDTGRNSDLTLSGSSTRPAYLRGSRHDILTIDSSGSFQLATLLYQYLSTHFPICQCIRLLSLHLPVSVSILLAIASPLACMQDMLDL